MESIKFCCNFPKLHNQKKARLVQVRAIAAKQISEKFLSYDTIQPDGSHYQLDSTGTFIRLVFIGDLGIPFSTLRKFSAHKYDFFRSNLNKMFWITILKQSGK